MNFVQLLTTAAVTATVMTVLGEGLDRWEKTAISLGTFFLTLFIVKLMQHAASKK